jgi:hypothetical protein
MTGWWWIGFGTLAITAWGVAASNAGSALLPLDQWVLEGLARLRTPALTRVMQAVAELGSRGVIIVLGWATILVLVLQPHFLESLALSPVATTSAGLVTPPPA